MESSIYAEEVHIWTAAPGHFQLESTQRQFAALLSPGENDRWRRFHFDADRLIYLVAHALVRRTLSHYEPSITPVAWAFVENAHGRPEIVPGQARQPLRFNLSHTQGLVACAVTLSRDIGVDVEHLRARSFDLSVAKTQFSAREQRDLYALPEEAQRERFFEIWTLKEAYIKARGIGLALPLDQFAFDLTGDVPRISIDRRLGDEADGWQFQLFRPTAEHLLAIAARRDQPQPLALSLRPALGDILEA